MIVAVNSRKPFFAKVLRLMVLLVTPAGIPENACEGRLVLKGLSLSVPAASNALGTKTDIFGFPRQPLYGPILCPPTSAFVAAQCAPCYGIHHEIKIEKSSASGLFVKSLHLSETCIASRLDSF